MDDVTDADGPFCLQPRPRSVYLMRNGFGDRDDYRLPDTVLEDPEHMIKLTGPAGTAIAPFAYATFSMQVDMICHD